ncbi:MAG: hypothetical protein PHX22_12260 [Dysgonamonadaceae bacterium]|nr:hypothetical protein [Dysgonamonadaceae bacterium]
MSKIKSVQVQCMFCKGWFRSPFGFGDTQSFESSTLTGNKAQCPNCGNITDSNKENMKVIHENGEIIGELIN